MALERVLLNVTCWILLCSGAIEQTTLKDLVWLEYQKSVKVKSRMALGASCGNGSSCYLFVYDTMDRRTQLGIFFADQFVVEMANHGFGHTLGILYSVLLTALELVLGLQL